MQVSEDAYIIETERLNQLTEYVCSVYNLSYHDLADRLGVNRGWFTRMRNGGYGEWRWGAVTGLVKMAAGTNTSMLLNWIHGNNAMNDGDSQEQPTNGLV